MVVLEKLHPPLFVILNINVKPHGRVVTQPSTRHRQSTSTVKYEEPNVCHLNWSRSTTQSMGKAPVECRVRTPGAVREAFLSASTPIAE